MVRLLTVLIAGPLALATKLGWFVVLGSAALVSGTGVAGTIGRLLFTVLRGAGWVLTPFFGRQWRQPEEWTAFSAHPPRAYDLSALTGRLLLMGDNQLQHVFGEPDSTSNIFDRWSEPSTRPALSTLFGELLLEEALEPPPQPDGSRPEYLHPVVHLGDATNTSCRSEWRRFARTILAAKRASNVGPDRPFVMLPGNHDGFLYGNFGAVPLSSLPGTGPWSKLARMLTASQWPEWSCRCADPLSSRPGTAGPMNKPEFIRRYLALLRALYGRQTGPRRSIEAAELGVRFGQDRGSWHVYRPARVSGSFVVLAIARIDDQVPGNSFIVQVIRWPGPQTPTCRRWAEREAVGEPLTSPPDVLGVLLDTCDYPLRLFAAGTQGSISRTQTYVAEHALGLALDRQRDAPTFVSFFGHHNLGALLPTGRWVVGRLFSRLSANHRFRVLPVYVSAHRHKGGWLHGRLGPHSLSFGEHACVDLNISSLVDWPLAVRDVSLAARAEAWGAHHVVVSSRQRPLMPDDPIGHVTERLVEDARRIALSDVLGQRRNPSRSSALRRLKRLYADPERDALAAEIALQVATARTLVLLLDHPSMPAGERIAAQAAAAALRAAISVETQAERATPPVDRFDREPSRPSFEALRASIHASMPILRRAGGSARAPTAFRTLLRAAIINAAREDQHRQWVAQPHLIPAVADRWYRRASNIDERHALVRPIPPRA